MAHSMSHHRVLVGFALLGLVSGCWSGPGSIPLPAVRGLDGVIASEVVDSVEAELRALGEDSEIVRRYGKLKSIKSTSLERRDASKAPFGPGGSPACLIVYCQCEFELYPDDLEIFIMEGQPKSEWTMEPKPEAIPADCKPTVKEQKLSFNRPDGNQLELPSRLTFAVQHPKFKP
jgi:hypothetical protein